MHTPGYNNFQKQIQRFPLTEMPDIVLRTAGNKTDSNKARDTNVYNFMVTQRGGHSLRTFRPQPPTKENTAQQPCDACFFLNIFNAPVTWTSALQLLLTLHTAQYHGAGNGIQYILVLTNLLFVMP